MQRSNIHIGFPSPYSDCRSTSSQVGVHQRPNVFVASATLAPQVIKNAHGDAREFERAPDPGGAGISPLDPDLLHRAEIIGQHRIEALRLIDREQEEGQRIVSELPEGIYGKPD